LSGVTIVSAARFGTSERRAHERDGSGEIAEPELCADADDAKAGALELAVAARIRELLALVNGVIDLDDELDAWR